MSKSFGSIFSIVLCMALASFVTQVHAADSGPDFYVSGFGTGALTSSNTSNAEFVQNSQASGTKSGEWRTGVDSVFGLQSIVVFNDWLSVTGQGLVRKVVTDEYGATLAWGFVKLKATDELAFRIGRMGVPVYMITDYRFIGYSNTMIRPPTEEYSQVNFDYLDGVDATYKHDFNDTTITAQFGVGTSTAGLVGGGEGKFTNLTALNVVVENGPFTVRFGRIDTKATAVNFPAFNNFAALLASVGYPNQGQEFVVDHTKASFTSLGLGIAWNNLIVQSEYAVRRSDSLSIQDTTSWYLMGGYKIGQFTPYAVHSTIKQDANQTVAGLPTTGPVAALTAVADAIANSPLQTTNSVGLRWDFRKSMDLKVQIDRVSPVGNGFFANATSPLTGPVNVYAVGIDFVF
jgi:hypothetical protein